MKKVIIILALAMGIVTANAQENVTVVTDNGSEQPTLTKEVYPQKTAYEIGTGDWSSDVCSSDLISPPTQGRSSPPTWARG